MSADFNFNTTPSLTLEPELESTRNWPLWKKHPRLPRTF